MKTSRLVIIAALVVACTAGLAFLIGALLSGGASDAYNENDPGQDPYQLSLQSQAVIPQYTTPQPTESNQQSSEDQWAHVLREYELTAGNFIASEDLPSGTMDVFAVEGAGVLYSSNLGSGGVNETFGVDDGSGLYTEEFVNFSYPAGTTLTVQGNLRVRIVYTEVTSNYIGRRYDNDSPTQLTFGTYTCGVDFPAGTYGIVAYSGTGTLRSSNAGKGGVNELFGISEDQGFYNKQFLNAAFNDGDTLTLGGNLTVNIYPAYLDN
jgi:hypothetical protein